MSEAAVINPLTGRIPDVPSIKIRELLFSVAVAMALTISSASAFAQAQKWGDSLPPDGGAIVLLVPKVASDKLVVVRDSAGRLLDLNQARTDKPFLREYRLAPGVYELKLLGLPDIKVNVSKGEMTTVKISNEEIIITNGPTLAVQSAQETLHHQGVDVEPIYISPQDSTLYFSAE